MRSPYPGRVRIRPSIGSWFAPFPSLKRYQRHSGWIVGVTPLVCQQLRRALGQNELLVSGEDWRSFFPTSVSKVQASRRSGLRSSVPPQAAPLLDVRQVPDKEPHCISEAETWAAIQVPSSTVQYRMQNALIAISCLYRMLIHRDEHHGPFNFVSSYGVACTQTPLLKPNRPHAAKAQFSFL